MLATSASCWAELVGAGAAAGALTGAFFYSAGYGCAYLALAEAAASAALFSSSSIFWSAAFASYWISSLYYGVIL